MTHPPLEAECNPRVTRSRHRGVCLQARAAICADAQERVLDYSDRVFEAGPTETRGLVALAESMGMDASFGACLASKETTWPAMAANVRATPAVFIDGRQLVGVPTPKDIDCLVGAGRNSLIAGDEVGPGLLLQRLEALERQNRRLKVAGTAVLAVLLVAAGALLVRRQGSQGPLWASRMIDAGGVVLRGPDGAVQALLAVGAEGTVRLSLFDKDGTPRTTLGTNGLYLAGKVGKGGVTVETEADGSARLTLLGPNGRRAAWLGALADGSRALFLSDPDETSAAMLSAGADGELRQILADKQHGQGANLSLPPDGSPHLDLSPRQGKGGATLGVTASGVPWLRLFDQDGRAGAALMAAEGVAGLRLLDREGKDVAGLVTNAEGWSRVFLSADGSAGGDKAGAVLGVSTEGAPALALFDQRGKTRAVLGRTSRRGDLDPRGAFSMVLLDEGGKLLYRAPKF